MRPGSTPGRDTSFNLGGNMKKQKPPKKRNPLWNHPKLTKGGKHRKLRRRNKQIKERLE